jgi:hypothetical protein
MVEIDALRGTGSPSSARPRAPAAAASATEWRASPSSGHRSDTALDTRDIRCVSPGHVLGATGLDVGDLDLLDGSPPCQSFSSAGLRQRSWGRVMGHADGTRQRSDELFFEYARLLDGLRPRVFVAENVSGLVKGVAKGHFKEILRALKGCGYRHRPAPGSGTLSGPAGTRTPRVGHRGSSSSSRIASCRKASAPLSSTAVQIGSHSSTVTYRAVGLDR